MKKLILLLIIAVVDISKTYSQIVPNPLFDSTIALTKAMCGYDPATLKDPTLRIAGGGSMSIFSMPKSSYPPNAIFNCGKFQLYYEDIALATGNGFDDAVVGNSRRTTLCAVYQYIQSIFDFSNVLATDPITIEVQMSYTTSNPSPNPMVLAMAGPVYPNSLSQGIYNGSVLNHLLTGSSPVASLFDGVLQVNFAPIFQNTTTLPIANCQYDLFGVSLHEVGHQLGFGSLLKETPSFVPVSGFGNNQYTLFDWQNIWHGDINFPITEKIVAGTFVAPVINPALVNPINDLRDMKLWLNNQPRFKNNLPIYSGVYGTWSSLTSGSVASHLCGDYLSWTERYALSPGFMKPHSMGPFFDYGENRRAYTEQEIRIFLQLGYTLNPLLSVAFQNIINTNHTPYTTKQVTSRTAGTIAFLTWPDLVQTADFTTTNGVPVVINLATDATLNDIDGDPITVENNTLFNIRGCGNGGNNSNQLSVVGNIITFTPRNNFIGRAQFGFYLTDGKERGSFMVYTIDVNPSITFLNTPNVNTPLGNTELIINGDFEEGTEVRRYGNPIDEAKINTPIQINREEGLYYGGNNLSDAHPLQYFNWLWTSSGGIIVGNAEKACSQPTTPIRFGSKPFSFPNFIWNHPTPTSGGIKYSYILGNDNYSRIYQPLVQCSRYIAHFDVNFINSGLISGDTYTLNLLVHSAVAFPTNPALQTIPIVITVGTGWQTITVPFVYCASGAGNYLNFVGTGNRVYYDNVSLIQDLSPPPPLIVTASASPNPICNLSSSTLTATATNIFCNATYTWQPGNIVGNPITISPSSTTNYTVTVNDGCRTGSAPVTLTVVPNCSTNPDCSLASTLPPIPIGATSATTSIPNNSVVDVQGLFTINSTVTYTNVKFRMAAGARIDITSGNTLTLNKCHLFSCTLLWKEITVNANANLVVQKYTIIEDSEQAIHWSNGGSVNINSSIFNRNGAGLHLEGAATAPNVVVSNTIFTCRDFPNSLYLTNFTPGSFGSLKTDLYNNILLYPYGSLIAPAPANTRSLYGVLSTQVAATIGITGNFQKRNLFDYLDFGINVSNANFTVINNAFANISGYDGSTAVLFDMKGIGVYAKAKPGFTITIGGTNLLNRNLFKNCYRGANITDYLTVNFINNILTNTTTSPTFIPPSYEIGFYGLALFSTINTSNVAALNYTITNNNVDNNSTGIFINSIYTQIASQNILIKNNNLNVTGSGTYCNQGIWMQSLTGSAATVGSVNVTNNTVKNSEINALLFENVNNQLNVSINNELSVMLNTNQSKQVIRLNNCKAAVVSDNGSIRTTNNTTTIPSGSPSNFITGIYLGNCQSSVITCNTIRFVDVCVLFDQSNSMDQFRTNDMNKARIGLVLANGAIIGQQGDATHPSGNVWGPHNPTNIKNFHTYTFSTFGANTDSKLYCKPNVQTNCAVGFKTLPCSNGANVPANVYIIGTGINTATGLSPNCTAKMGNALANAKSLLHEADSGNGSAVDKFLQKRQAFHLIKTDTTGLLMADNELSTFYTLEQSQNLGKISTTSELIGNNSFVAAQSTNSSITPTNVAEHNTKAVNDIWLQSLLDTNYVLTTTDSSTLYTIGSICLQQGGDATVLARALLANFTQTTLTFTDCMELPFEGEGNRTANNKTVDGNLILNGSIEDINWDTTGYEKFAPWEFPQYTSPDVFLPNSLDPSFFSNDTNLFGYQLPQHGVNYFGGSYFVKIPTSTPNYVREPIIAKTSVTLTNGVQYCLAYYISLADIENCAVNRIDAYFSPTPMDPTLGSPPYLIYVQPQVMADSTIFYTDKMNWTRIEGSYTAVGGENYITIGNLHLDSETDTLCNGVIPGYPNNKEAYYYMDNFSLEEIKPVDAGLDVTITSGDTIVIGNNADSASSYVWSPNYFIADTTAVNATVNPPVTTTYYVTKTQCSVTTTDTVTVVVNPVGVSEVSNENNVQIYPNPNNGSFTITHNLTSENYVLEVVDVMGKVVHREQITAAKQIINTQQLSKGLYFVNVKTDIGKLVYTTKMSVIH